MDIKDEAVKGAVVKAIIDTLTAEKRDELLKGAVKSLLDAPEQRSGHYGDRAKSKVEEMFNAAVADFAREHIRAALKDDPVVKGAVDELLRSALAKFAEKQSDAVAEKIAGALETALSKRDY